MNEPVKGRIHSFESCGMVDGPGLRFIAFLQGCPLRCLYCHNPDSWNFSGGLEMTSAQVVEEAWKYRTWMKTSGGGMTLSGGEPLAQRDFTLDILQRARRKNIHTAIDTSGLCILEKTKPCLDEADLVIMDIKSANPLVHKNLTGIDQDGPLATLDYLKSIEKPLWLRHVLVPGLTDSPEDLENLKKLLLDVPNLKRFELLPFHKMGEEKWAQEGIPYTLTETPSPEKEDVQRIFEDFMAAGIPISEH